PSVNPLFLLTLSFHNNRLTVAGTTTGGGGIRFFAGTLNSSSGDFTGGGNCTGESVTDDETMLSSQSETCSSLDAAEYGGATLLWALLKTEVKFDGNENEKAKTDLSAAKVGPIEKEIGMIFHCKA
ncbi:hypothetical protein M8C21_028529, partial [Ambrosia artemisiifolia]